MDIYKNISARINFVQGLNLPINSGEKYYVNIDIYNETGSPMDRTFMATQGHYNAATDTFEEAAGHTIFDKTINPGNQTTQIFGQGQDSGNADILVGYGVAHVYDWPPFFLESGFIILDAIYVKSFRFLNFRTAKQVDDGHQYGIVVAPDEQFYMEIKTDNTKDSPVVKDYIACYGEMSPCGTFTIEYYFLMLDVANNSGETLITNIPCQIPELGVYDILTGCGNWDETTQTFNFEHQNGRYRSLIVD
jgi:hypothetical protein